MDREELADRRFATRYGRLVHADEVDALMLPWLLDHDKAEIFKAGQERGLGFAFVATMQDILDMEQLTARDYFIDLDHPVGGPMKYPGPPMRVTSPQSPPSQAPPLQGRDSNVSSFEKEGTREGDACPVERDGWVYRRAPLLGEHTAELLHQRLGYSVAEIARLKGKGVI
jgi:crotonobetainyl-CoA:carnitine CoA-transferase CaiB-like acyl-CoA transferase